MKRYSEYKDSGVKWIGEIPEHWKIAPFGRHFSYGKGLPITKADLQSEGTPVISYGQIHSKKNTGTKIDENLIRYVHPSYIDTNPQSLLKENDFIFADTSEDIEGCGNCAYNDINGNIFAGYHTVIARPQNILFPKYYAYLFQSKNWKTQIQTLVNGVKVYSINRGILKQSILLIPQKDEQEAIVTYLDTKVAKIDEYISIAEKKIAALEELKQTIIAEAVTRGIHKDVPMKDSGVKWIGMIPEHWTVCKMRKSIYEINIKNNPIKTTQILSLTNKQGVIPYEDKGNQGNKAKEDISSYKIAFKDNIIMNSMNVIIGSVGLSNYEGCVSPVYYVYGIREGTDKHFINYICQLSFFQKELRRFAKGILEIRLRVSSKDIQNTYIALPSLSEQQEIVTYIEAKVASINQLCQAERAQIEKLKEYKQRLISDVVTGKVKVTND